MFSLVPIKVKIGLRANGHADHPNWLLLPMITSEDQLKANIPYGWHYDKSCGHQEDNGSDSPHGMQWGMLLVEKDFAIEAIAIFPSLVSEMTETEAEDFYDNRCCKHILENKINSTVLDDLYKELILTEKIKGNTTALEAKISKALNPDNNEPGIFKNKDKIWKDMKVQRKFKIVST